MYVCGNVKRIVSSSKPARKKSVKKKRSASAELCKIEYSGADLIGDDRENKQHEEKIADNSETVFVCVK